MISNSWQQNVCIQARRQCGNLQVFHKKGVTSAKSERGSPGFTRCQHLWLGHFVILTHTVALEGDVVQARHLGDRTKDYLPRSSQPSLRPCQHKISKLCSEIERTDDFRHRIFPLAFRSLVILNSNCLGCMNWTFSRGNKNFLTTSGGKLVTSGPKK